MSLVGNLEDLGLGEILQIVSLSRKSGVLTLCSRGREGNIVFRQGQVIRATSPAYREGLGEVLVRKGLIDNGLASAIAAWGGVSFLVGLWLFRWSGFRIPPDRRAGRRKRSWRTCGPVPTCGAFRSMRCCRIRSRC